jgi:hypothetical protein
MVIPDFHRAAEDAVVISRRFGVNSPRTVLGWL